jgi:hypothetical protein
MMNTGVSDLLQSLPYLAVAEAATDIAPPASIGNNCLEERFNVLRCLVIGYEVLRSD